MKHSPDGFNDPALRGGHAIVIERYCTQKKRAYVDGAFSFSDPPTYHMISKDTIAGVELVTKTRAHVDTKFINDQAYRFIVLKKKDGWRVDSIKRRFNLGDDAPWQNCLIGS